MTSERPGFQPGPCYIYRISKKGNPMKLNSNELMLLIARLAHRAATDEMADIQQRATLREALSARFGPDAVPGNPALRPIYGDQVLSRNHELIDRERLNDLARHNRLVEVVKALEAAFAEHKAQQDQAFVEFLAAYLRRNQGT